MSSLMTNLYHHKNQQQQQQVVVSQLDDHDIVQWFEGVAENAGRVQAQTLKRIIQLNHNTEYLRKWLGEVNKMEDMEPAAVEALYTSLVPLASHSDLQPYIQRIADGDGSQLLTQHPITMLSLRSPTSLHSPVLRFLSFNH